MSTKEILIGARENLKLGWTKGCFARSAKGAPVETYSSEATCWCLIGAVRVSAYRLYQSGKTRIPASKALTVLQSIVPGGHVASFNDKQTSVDDVLALIDQAIQVCDR